jgi:hypothetical protein
VQASPLWHATQVPLLSQTKPVPHVLPGALLPLSAQTCTPVEQENAPVLQGLVGWQAPLAAHVTHCPVWQTWPVPHEVPS